MLDLPFSKLKIKIHALDNPTSVFKKRNLLSLNCINKSNSKKKSITPLRTYNNLPHYMMPKKSQLNQNNNNNKENNLRASSSYVNKKFKNLKNNGNDSKSNLPHLSRGKNDNLNNSQLYNSNKKNNLNSSFKKNKNKDLPNINNSCYTIKWNDKNNINQNQSLNYETNKMKNGLNGSNYPNNYDINDININEQNFNYFNDIQNNYNSNDINNNEILLTEQNVKNYSSDSNDEKNNSKQFQLIISEMQKKINEQNQLLSDRIKEIEKLKKEVNENKIRNNNNIFNDDNINNLNIYKNESEILNKELERYKSLLNDYKENNKEKNKENEKNILKISKLQKELEKLKESIKLLYDKYETELNNNKILEQKYNYIKNNTRTPEELKKQYEDRIKDQVKEIKDLKDKLYKIELKKNLIKRCKNAILEIKGHSTENENKEKIQIARTLTREFIVKIEVLDGKISNNNDDANENMIIQDSPSKRFFLSSKNSNSSTMINPNDNNKIILTEKQYNNIQLLLNILLILNGISEDALSDKINKFQNKRNDKKEKEDNINSLVNEICKNLRIKNKDLIKQFINDFMIKDKKGDNVLKELFKYKKTDKSFESNIKKNIFEKCEIYDYKKKKTIPFNYFKHLCKENFYNIKKSFTENEFFNILYECKIKEENNNNNNYSLFDIFYYNLIKEGIKNNENKNNEIKMMDIGLNDKETKLKNDINYLCSQLIVDNINIYF